MRIEGRNDHRPSLVRSALDRSPDHRLVAEVEAVEIAQRNNGAAHGVGDRLIVGQALQLGQGLTGLNCKSRRLTRQARIPKCPPSRFTGHRRRSPARAVFPLEGANALRWGGRVPAALWS